MARKTGICLQNICSSRSIFTNVASALQGFYSTNPMEYLVHPLLDEGRIREPKSRSVLRACKFARQPEESGAQFAQGQALPFFRETGPLKSRDQVVGQPNYFQIEGVGSESTRGNLSERIVITKLSDAWLHSGAAIVEVPHPGR